MYPTQLYLVIGRSLTLANHLYQEEKQTLHIFMRGGSFAAWSKVPTYGRLPSSRNWEIAVLSPLMFTCQTDGSQVLEKHVLGHGADQRPIYYWKRYIHISKRGKSTFNYKFSRVNAQRKRRKNSFLTGRIEPLLFHLYLSLDDFDFILILFEVSKTSTWNFIQQIFLRVPTMCKVRVRQVPHPLSLF